MQLINLSKAKIKVEDLRGYGQAADLPINVIIYTEKDVNRKNHYLKPVLKQCEEGGNYRGLCFGNDIFIFYNEIETIGSIKWIYAHEMTHYFIGCNKNLQNYINFIGKIINSIIEKKYTKKQMQEKYKMVTDPEEFLCNSMATLLCSKDFGNQWYYNRKQKKEKKNVRNHRNSH